MVPESWQAAAALAARLHRDDVRDDGTTPYFAHPARVASAVARFGCVESDVLAAAYLHDTLEKTDLRVEELKDRFGGEVARLVETVSRDRAIPEAAREDDLFERLARADWRPRLIKIADEFDNLADLFLGVKSDPRAVSDRCRRVIDVTQHDRHESIRRGIAALILLSERAERPSA